MLKGQVTERSSAVSCQEDLSHTYLAHELESPIVEIIVLRSVAPISTPITKKGLSHYFWDFVHMTHTGTDSLRAAGV